MNDEVEKLLELGQMDLEAGYPEYARHYFEKVLKLDPSHQEARKALAKIEAMLTRERTAAVGPKQDRLVKPPYKTVQKPSIPKEEAEAQTRSPAQQSKKGLREGAKMDTSKIGMAIVLGVIAFAVVYFGLGAYIDHCWGYWGYTDEPCGMTYFELEEFDQSRDTISLIAGALVSGAALVVGAKKSEHQ
jgi:hypothetical protein